MISKKELFDQLLPIVGIRVANLMCDYFDSNTLVEFINFCRDEGFNIED